MIWPLTVIESLQKILNTLLPVILLAFGYGVLGIVWGQFAATIIISLVAFSYYTAIRRRQQFVSFIDLLREKLHWPSIRYYFQYGFLTAISKNIIKVTSTVPFLILAAVAPTNSALG